MLKKVLPHLWTQSLTGILIGSANMDNWEEIFSGEISSNRVLLHIWDLSHLQHIWVAVFSPIIQGVFLSTLKEFVAMNNNWLTSYYCIFYIMYVQVRALHTDPPCVHISRNIKVNKNCRHLWQNAAIRVLMTAPIFFWRNSDLFKKKEHFSSSKIDKIKVIQKKSTKFYKEILSNSK